MKRGRKFRRGALAVCFAATALAAAEPETILPPEHVDFFESKIRPTFVEHCYKCHSVESGKSKADLRLDTRDALRQGGASGAAIVPGDPEKSLLIEAVRYRDEDLQMPPKDEGGKLSDEQIAALEHWVKLGAPDPRTGGPAHPMDLAAARGHWAFQPIAKPVVPAVKATAAVTTPVDAFVVAALEAKGLTRAPAADRRTLLRRITYDLTGLPPTAEEMEAFLADRAPDAYERTVDRLLSSPRYGERWGRFWLDVARYADTKGYLAGNVERRFTFSHTYRDYVIKAFNDDKPFDRFVVEQLAADHLALGEDKSALAGLGFLTLGRRFLNNQNDIIDDRIDVVTRGLMGLTVACARCHDHKFDPVPTKDYYSLHGVFASSEEPADKPLLGPLAETPAYEEYLGKKAAIEVKIKERETEEVNKFLAGLRTTSGDYLLGAHDARQLPPTEKLEVFAGVRKLNVEVLRRWQTFLTERATGPDRVLAPWFALAALPAEGFAQAACEMIDGWRQNAGNVHGPAINGIVLKAFARESTSLTSLKEVAGVYNGIFAEMEKMSGAAAGEPDRAEVRALVSAEDAPANISYASAADLLRRQIGNRVAELKREIEALSWKEPGAPLRAMALVDKASPKNSRVLVRGNAGNPGPEVPRRFLEILSGAERRPFQKGSGRLELAEHIASADNPLTARVFVNRVWGWHFGSPLVATPSDFGVRTEAPRHRALLDWLAASFIEQGWSVKRLHRTMVLSQTYQQSSDGDAAALAADPDNGLLHHFPRRRLELEALRDTLLAVAGRLDLRGGGIPDDLTTEPFSTRRTVYGLIDRQNLPGMFRTFDYPSPDVSAAGRFATTVPQQALFFLNSAFVQEQARQMARRGALTADASDAQKIERLYRVLFQRAPEPEEMALARGFLDQSAAGAEVPPAVGGGWAYGRGHYDAATGRVRDFAALDVRRDGRAQAGAKYPDTTYGSISVTAAGGHPGRTPAQASIRRWTAPVAGQVKVEGALGHGSANGDGVVGRIVSSEQGGLGEWTVHNDRAPTRLEDVRVKAGESLDFLVEPGANPTADGYTWAPTITLRPEGEMPSRIWNARRDFDAPPVAVRPLDRWEQFAQVLLMSNELAFVD